MRAMVCAAALLLVVSGGGCGGEEGGEGGPETGRVVVSISGGTLVEEGMPSVQFDDDWSVEFHKYVVLVHDPVVACAGAALPLPSGCGAFDLTQSGGVELATFEDVEVGSCGPAEYGVAPVPQECVGLGGNADSAVVQKMIDEQRSVYVEGVATKGGLTIEFSWGFSPVVRFTECPVGAAVEADVDAQVTLVLRGDRIFLDDLESSDAVFRFLGIMFADGDADGVTTEEELKLLAGQVFHGMENYGVGSVGVNSMYEYLSHLSGSMGFGDGPQACILE